MTSPHQTARHAAVHGVALEVTAESAGWRYSGLRVLELAAESRSKINTGPEEIVVVPLAGSCTVAADGVRAKLAGRRSVFDGVTDVAYVPCHAELILTSERGGRFALASARTSTRLPFRLVAADEVPVELRGAGSCSRQIHNLGTPDVLKADRIIVCEVITPGGNWSSYPPHKHDELKPGESELEEIYYFEIAKGGPAYQRVYGTPERPIDVLAEVHTGDVVLVPHGWHGPSMAAPGYDLYYLNVMAGPGRREWSIRDDPAHAWIRETWAGQPIDPRLPIGRVRT
jgi:5-deoxy-glucuronate isomerase